jgi:uncharacterized protein involved in exopolysaccharide biosynthesis
MEAQEAVLETAKRMPPGAREDLNLLDMLIVIAKGKKIIASATLVAFVVGVLISLLIPNRYTATTKILPPQQSQSLASSLMGQLGALGPMAAMSQGSFGIKNPNDTYVGMLKSRTVEDNLIRRFDLMNIYRDKLMSDTRTDLERASAISTTKEGFINISVEDKSPKRAADMANAYVEELRKLTQNLAVTEAGQRRLFFEQQLEQAKDNLAHAEEALKTTQQSTGIIQLDGQAKAIIESVVTLRAQIAAKEVQLRAMRSFATEQNPDLMLLEQQIAGMRAQLAEMEKKSGGDGDIQVATGKVPAQGLEYVRKMRDVKYYETIFELLAKQFEAAKLDEAKSAAVIQVVDPAIEPDRKSSPKLIPICVFSVTLGMLGSVVFILIRSTSWSYLHDVK